MLFQLTTGLLNIAQWYAFKFFFTTSHYAMAYVAAGAVIVHIAVKLPVIRRALGEPLDDVATGGPSGRRGGRCCAAPWLAVGAGDRRDRGPDGAAAAQGVGAGAAFRRRAARGSGQPLGDRRRCAAQRAVAGLPADGHATGRRRRRSPSPNSPRCRRPPHRLPIACVEGWSADAEWTGVVLADLVAAVGGVARLGRADDLAGAAGSVLAHGAARPCMPATRRR